MTEPEILDMMNQNVGRCAMIGAKRMHLGMLLVLLGIGCNVTFDRVEVLGLLLMGIGGVLGINGYIEWDDQKK